MIHNEHIVEEPQEVALRRSQEKGDQLFRMTMWYTYMKQKDLSINDNDLISFSQAVSCDNSKKWLNSMKEKINSMENNDV